MFGRHNWLVHVRGEAPLAVRTGRLFVEYHGFHVPDTLPDNRSATTIEFFGEASKDVE